MNAWPVLLDDWAEWVEEIGKEAAGIPAAGGDAAVDLTA